MQQALEVVEVLGGDAGQRVGEAAHIAVVVVGVLGDLVGGVGAADLLIQAVGGGVDARTGGGPDVSGGGGAFGAGGVGCVPHINELVFGAAPNLGGGRGA